MTRVNGGAISPKRTPVRHAADLDFHLANALRSATLIEQSTRDDREGGKAAQIKEILRALRRQAREMERSLTR